MTGAEDGAGAWFALGGTACVRMARRARLVGRRVEALARKVELAHRDVDRRLAALEARAGAEDAAGGFAVAAAALADLTKVCDTVREMIGHAEEAVREPELGPLPTQD